jgi:hypothetical protein
MFDVRNVLESAGDDILEREQYFDFLCLRRFRQTLLCRAEVPLRRPAAPESMDAFLFSSPARQREGQIEGANSVSVPDPPPQVARVATMLGAAHPLPVAFDDLLTAVPDRDALRAILFALIASGFAEFHVHHFTSQRPIAPRPCASKLMAWETGRGNSVTYATHTTLTLDPIGRSLIALLDGTRDFGALAEALAQTAGAPDAHEIRARLPHILAHMSATGLLAS